MFPLRLYLMYLMELMMIRFFSCSVIRMNQLILIVLVFLILCLNKFVFVIWLLRMQSGKPLSQLNNWLISWIYRPFSVLTNDELADYVWNYILLLQNKLTNVTPDK